MKKIFLVSLISLLTFDGAHAAGAWWEHDTICRLSPSNCYATMGAGYFFDTTDPASWDITSNCWGKKYICADALKNTTGSDSVPMGRAEIADASRINSDFDINVLNGDCFGVRKTSSGGAMASVNGNFVRVWCAGILDNPDDEYLENGEITSGVQPTCTQLATNGYVGIQNGKCFGKHYDESQYAIQCDGETPTLIVLNGADPTGVSSNANIKTQADADNWFNKMHTIATGKQQ